MVRLLSDRHPRSRQQRQLPNIFRRRRKIRTGGASARQVPLASVQKRIAFFEQHRTLLSNDNPYPHVSVVVAHFAEFNVAATHRTSRKPVPRRSAPSKRPSTRRRAPCQPDAGDPPARVGPDLRRRRNASIAAERASPSASARTARRLAGRHARPGVRAAAQQRLDVRELVAASASRLGGNRLA